MDQCPNAVVISFLTHTHEFEHEQLLFMYLLFGCNEKVTCIYKVQPGLQVLCPVD